MAGAHEAPPILSDVRDIFADPMYIGRHRKAPSVGDEAWQEALRDSYARATEGIPLTGWTAVTRG